MSLISPQDTFGMLNALEGEAIVYLEVDEEPKDLIGIVDRSPKEVADVSGQAKHGRTKYVLSIANDDATGMTSIRSGQDKVECKRLVSDTDLTTFVITSILSMDEGGWQLEITA